MPGYFSLFRAVSSTRTGTQSHRLQNASQPGIIITKKRMNRIASISGAVYIKYLSLSGVRQYTLV